MMFSKKKAVPGVSGTVSQKTIRDHVREGNLELVKQYVKQYAIGINSAIDYFPPLLHQAAFYGQYKVVLWLLQQDGIEPQTIHGTQTALQHALIKLTNNSADVSNHRSQYLKTVALLVMTGGLTDGTKAAIEVVIAGQQTLIDIIAGKQDNPHFVAAKKDLPVSCMLEQFKADYLFIERVLLVAEQDKHNTSRLDWEAIDGASSDSDDLESFDLKDKVYEGTGVDDAIPKLSPCARELKQPATEQSNLPPMPHCSVQ